MKKTNVLISFTSEESAKHINARRLNVPDFYQCPDDVYAVLNSLYKNKNRVRDARRQFGTLEMKSGQTFSSFYSEFILLANQLADYSKKTKIDALEEKITPKLQVAIASSEKFDTLKALKDHLQMVDTRLSSIRSMPSSKNTRGRYSGKTPAKITPALPDRLVAPAAARAASSIERKAIKNISARLAEKNDC